MDDVDVHLLLFPYYICTAMGKKVMPENNNKTYRFWLEFPCYIHEMQIYKHQEMSAKAYKLFFEGKKIVTLNPDESIPMNSNNCVKIKKIFLIVTCQFKIVFSLRRK
jgi:hypothetical protein